MLCPVIVYVIDTAWRIGLLTKHKNEVTLVPHNVNNGVMLMQDKHFFLQKSIPNYIAD